MRDDIQQVEAAETERPKDVDRFERLMEIHQKLKPYYKQYDSEDSGRDVLSMASEAASLLIEDPVIDPNDRPAISAYDNLRAKGMNVNMWNLTPTTYNAWVDDKTNEKMDQGTWIC